MEVALARLVGAGLTLVFEGFEESVPSGAVENGLRLIQHIAQHRPDIVVSLTEGIVRDIWSEWREAKLPNEVAIAHIEALPSIMDRCRSSDGMMLGAVAAIQVARRISTAARPVSHSARVATAIVGRALESGMLTQQGLNHSIAFFFLDRLLARLMPDQQLFLELRPLFVDYLDSGAWRASPDLATERHAAVKSETSAEPVSAEAEASLIASEPDEPASAPSALEGPSLQQPAAVEAAEAAARSAGACSPIAAQDASFGVAALETVAARACAPSDETDPAPVARQSRDGGGACEADADVLVDVGGPIARIAGEVGVPVHLLGQLAQSAHANLGALAESMIADLAHGLREILVQLEAPGIADPKAADLLLQAAAAVQMGHLEKADEVLGQLEDLHLKAAPLDLATAHAHLAEAATARAFRARFTELAGDYRKAARHYAVAARCIGDANRRTRRRFLMRQAGALVSRGELTGDTAALAEAAQVYADAGRLLSEQDDPKEWATSHLELGRILMELGDREKRPERYLAAALHFKPAADVFSRLKDADNWARTQLGLADALRAQGEGQGDIVTLSEAVFAYRAALGIATRDRMPAEWALATYRLALTLMRLDHETGELAHHDEAAMALRAMLASADSVPDTIRCNAQARLAQALLALGRLRSENWLEEEAIAVLRATRSEADRSLSGTMRARHDDHIGSLLREIGETRRNASLIGEAAELKLAALDHFQSRGEVTDAERIRAEITAIEQAMARITDLETADAAA